MGEPLTASEPSFDITPNGVTLTTSDGQFPLLIPPGTLVFAALSKVAKAGYVAIWEPRTPALILFSREQKVGETKVPFADYTFYNDRKIALQISALVQGGGEGSDISVIPPDSIEYQLRGRSVPVPYMFHDGLSLAAVKSLGVEILANGVIDASLHGPYSANKVTIEPGRDIIAVVFSRSPSNRNEIVLRAIHVPENGICQHEIMSLLHGLVRTEHRDATEYFLELTKRQEEDRE